MKRWKHKAWGASCRGVYDPSLRLVYTSKKDMWALIMFKIMASSRQAAVARGWGVCRVLVTKQQIED